MKEIKYIALTIGPIYKMFQNVHKTREVWMGSYFFSVVMEKIVEQAKKHGEVILPADPSVKLKNGAGIYPDRLILKLNDDFANIDIREKIITPAIIECSKALGISVDSLTSFLQIYFVVIDNTDLQKFELLDKDGKNIKSFIHRLNFILDNKELNAKYNSSNEAFFKSFFDNKTRRKFIDHAFNIPKKDFPSILEISATEKIHDDKDFINLLYKDDKELTQKEDARIKNEIKELAGKYKYMAILRADGDNFGKVISNISSDEEQVKSFSKNFVKFSEEASKIIFNYGGTVIYIGGDDILCFAPVVNNNKTIFTIVDELNKKFHDVFSDEIYKKENVSMSYGLSITYYKYPLNEALELSNKLLFEKAKLVKNKNCIAFQLLQHSGQYRETILEFGKGNTFDLFIKMLTKFTLKEQLLQSLTHKLVEDKEILLAIAGNNDRIAGYFENHFSHEEKDKSVHDFIDSVCNYLILNFMHFSNKEDALTQINSICRMLKFIDSNE